MVREHQPSVANQDPNEETLKAIILRFVDMVSRAGIDPKVVTKLSTRILSGLKYEYSPTAVRSHFYDLGLVEYGEPTGEYSLLIAEKTVKSRAEFLYPHVPPAVADSLALEWMTAHELGHAVQSAYSLVHESPLPDDSFAGLRHYPRPADVFLQQHPEEAVTEDPDKARTIENEKQAEGFAKIALIEGLGTYFHDRGLASITATQIYRARAEQMPPVVELIESKEPFALHEIGYSNPLNQEEVVARFKTIQQ